MHRSPTSDLPTERRRFGVDASVARRLILNHLGPSRRTMPNHAPPAPQEVEAEDEWATSDESDTANDGASREPAAVNIAHEEKNDAKQKKAEESPPSIAYDQPISGDELAMGKMKTESAVASTGAMVHNRDEILMFRSHANDLPLSEEAERKIKELKLGRRSPTIPFARRHANNLSLSDEAVQKIKDLKFGRRSPAVPLARSHASDLPLSDEVVQEIRELKHGRRSPVVPLVIPKLDEAAPPIEFRPSSLLGVMSTVFIPPDSPPAPAPPGVTDSARLAILRKYEIE